MRCKAGVGGRAGAGGGARGKHAVSAIGVPQTVLYECADSVQAVETIETETATSSV